MYEVERVEFALVEEDEDHLQGMMHNGSAEEAQSAATRELANISNLKRALAGSYVLEKRRSRKGSCVLAAGVDMPETYQKSLTRIVPGLALMARTEEVSVEERLFEVSGQLFPCCSQDVA